MSTNIDLRLVQTTETSAKADLADKKIAQLSDVTGAMLRIGANRYYAPFNKYWNGSTDTFLPVQFAGLNCTTLAASDDITIADGKSIKLGVGKGALQFDDETIDTLTVKDANFIVDDKVGIGTTTIPTACLLSVGSSSDNAYQVFLTPNNKTGGINFGDTDDDDIGFIKYNHATEMMSFGVNGEIFQLEYTINNKTARILGAGSESPPVVQLRATYNYLNNEEIGKFAFSALDSDGVTYRDYAQIVGFVADQSNDYGQLSFRVAVHGTSTSKAFVDFFGMHFNKLKPLDTSAIEIWDYTDSHGLFVRHFDNEIHIGPDGNNMTGNPLSIVHDSSDALGITIHSRKTPTSETLDGGNSIFFIIRGTTNNGSSYSDIGAGSIVVGKTDDFYDNTGTWSDSTSYMALSIALGGNVLELLKLTDVGVEISETSTPSSVASGKATLYLHDNSGSQELWVKFHNGTSKLLANDSAS